MDNFIDKRDYDLLNNDKYSYFVMRRVISGEHKLLLSNHQNIIILYTGYPYPLWIWTKDNANDDVYDKGYQILKEYDFLNKEYSFNLKPAFTNFLINKAKEDGINYNISLNLLSYVCDNVNDNINKASGYLHHCNDNDIDIACEMIKMFEQDALVNVVREDLLRDYTLERIRSGNMYFWKNEEDEVVSLLNYNVIDDIASINHVYTMKNHRRKHYGLSIVYEVTKKILDDGLTAMLYTDGDYQASNDCYKKIGYKLVGKLHQISC